MVPPPVPQDFKEFLKLFNELKVEYLLVGGHAVGLHGYVRYTADLDVWIAIHSNNAALVIESLKRFGFRTESLSAETFEQPKQLIRMGVPPLRIEIHTTITGVEFEQCYARRVMMQIEEVEVPVISLEDLKQNKIAAGRLKDRLDLENLNND